MFTGLVEELGVIKGITQQTLNVATQLDDIKIGDSIAINGVCLTVVKIQGDVLTFDYSPKTDELTNLSALKLGDKVNVERALKLSSRLGGHFVSGHIDAKAEVKSIQKNGDFLKLTFSLPVVIKPYIVDKGSIAINGISLTVAQVEAQSFSVFVIPQTIRNTTLFEVKTGALVNIEADILAKYTERLLNNSGEVSSKKQDDSLNEKFLKENGFF